MTQYAKTKEALDRLKPGAIPRDPAKRHRKAGDRRDNDNKQPGIYVDIVFRRAAFCLQRQV